MFSIQENSRGSDHIGSHIILGNRTTQQDAVRTEILDDLFIQLSHQDRVLALKNTIKEIQDAAPQHGGGSTLCSTLIWRDAERVHFYVVNVGDSAARMVIVNRVTNKKTIKRINTLHTTDPKKNMREFLHLKNALDSQESNPDGFSLQDQNGRGNWRLLALESGNHMNVSRAIADIEFAQSHPLFHEPDIYYFSEPLSDNEDFYIVLASDGLEVLNDADVLASTWSASAKDLARELLYKRKKYVDNTCAAVIQARPLREKILSAIVADGHGDDGDKFSAFIVKNFYEILKKHVEKLLLSSTASLDHAKLPISSELICQLIIMGNVGLRKSNDEIFELFNTANEESLVAHCNQYFQALPSFFLMVPEEASVFRWMDIKDEMLSVVNSPNFAQCMKMAKENFSRQLNAFQVLSREIYCSLFSLHNIMQNYPQLHSNFDDYLKEFEAYTRISDWEIEVSYDSRENQVIGVFHSFSMKIFLRAFEQYFKRLSNMFVSDSPYSSSALTFFEAPLEEIAHLMESEAYIQAKQG